MLEAAALLGRKSLSRITIASLADLGYEVNLDAADSYVPPTLPGTTTPCDVRVFPPNSPIAGASFRSAATWDEAIVSVVGEEASSAKRRK